MQIRNPTLEFTKPTKFSQKDSLSDIELSSTITSLDHRLGVSLLPRPFAVYSMVPLPLTLAKWYRLIVIDLLSHHLARIVPNLLRSGPVVPNGGRHIALRSSEDYPR